MKKEADKAVEGLFATLGETFKEFILSLQYHRFKGKSEESTQERMGRLWIKSTEPVYKDYDMRLKEQFINGLNDEDITAK